MTITAANFEANGWVLNLTLTATKSTAGSFSLYNLDPDGTPRITLTGLGAGYTISAGTAVADTPTRTIIGTKVLRKPVVSTNTGTRDAKTPDETDVVPGTSFRVRIALSQHVYANEAANWTLTTANGWRTGETAQTITVTNSSTLIAPQPLVRWSDVSYQLQAGSFDLEVVVAAQHPKALQPVAGVKFTVTDGTTIKTYWTTALSTSTRYSAGGTGKPLRVYKVTVDPTTATALTKGLLRCDYEVYPWIGAARLSDTAGSKSMTGLSTAALSGAAQVPFVVAYNPGNTWIVPRYAYVVSDNSGAPTASASLANTNPSLVSNTPCNSINIALESLRLGASTVTDGRPSPQSITQSVDGCVIRLKAGAHLGAGTANVTSGIQTLASWVIIEGDPADSDPLNNAIVRTPTTINGQTRVTRTLLRNLSIEGGANAIIASTSIWADNFVFRGATGSTGLNNVPLSSSVGLWTTNGVWKSYGLGLTKSGTTHLPVLVRNMQVERTLIAPVVLNCQRLPTSVVGTIGIGADGSATAPTVDAGRAQDRIAIGNELLYVSGANAMVYSFLANASAPANGQLGSAMGTTFPVVARQCFINNTVESYGSSFPMLLPVGENNPAVLTETIVEGNTLTGDRSNLDYNDLNMTTIALNDSTDSIALVNRRANNIYTKGAIKHDFFGDPVVSAQRTGTGVYSLATSRNKAKAVGDELTANGNIYRCSVAGTTATTGGPSGTGSAITDGTVTWAWFATADPRTHGYRPQAVSAWSALYGVNSEGNIDFQPPAQSDSEFFYEYMGRGSLQMAAAGVTVSTSPFTLDKSGTDVNVSAQMPWLIYNPANTGGGDYKPLRTGSGAYLLAKSLNGNVDVDQRGTLRSVPYTTGSIEADPATATSKRLTLLGVGQ